MVLLDTDRELFFFFFFFLGCGEHKWRSSVKSPCKHFHKWERKFITLRSPGPFGQSHAYTAGWVTTSRFQTAQLVYLALTAMRFICVIICCHLTPQICADWGHMEAVKNDVSLYRKQRGFFFFFFSPSHTLKESQLSSSWGPIHARGRVSSTFNSSAVKRLIRARWSGKNSKTLCFYG